MATNKSVNAGAGIDPALLAGSDPEVDALKAKIAQLLEENAALRTSAAVEEDGSANSSASASKERFGIVIDEGSGQFDLTEVPVQVNGRAYQIARGKYVEVPAEVISVLNDAVIDKAVSNTDATGMPAGITLRSMRRFPFQNFGLVIDADGKRVREPQAA